MKKKWVKICAIIIVVVFIVTSVLPLAMADDVDDQISLYQRQQQELQQQICSVLWVV